MVVDKADGSRIAVLIDIDPLLDARGKMVGLVTCFQDITERKQVYEALEQSQQDLRQQEQRWNATYEHAAIGIVEIDAEGRFLRVNESICDITGLSREELLGWRLFARTHPDDRDVDEDLYRRQVKGEIGFYSIEKRFVRKDGRVIWCSIRSSTVRDAGGNFLYGVRVVQDITARKEAEDRQKLLMDELNHRVKNTLATVQSLATQTARGTDSPEAFRQAFEGRLIALSQAHDQLTRRHWASADLRAIVTAAVAPYLTRGAGAGRDLGRRRHGDAARRAHARDGAARADHQCGQVRRAVGAGRAGRGDLAHRAGAVAAAAAVARVARKRRAAGGGADAARLRLALHRGQRRRRASGHRAAAFRCRRPALHHGDAARGCGAGAGT